jgi:hypothetical protein
VHLPLSYCELGKEVRILDLPSSHQLRLPYGAEQREVEGTQRGGGEWGGWRGEREYTEYVRIY